MNNIPEHLSRMIQIVNYLSEREDISLTKSYSTILHRQGSKLCFQVSGIGQGKFDFSEWAPRRNSSWVYWDPANPTYLWDNNFQATYEMSTALQLSLGQHMEAVVKKVISELEVVRLERAQNAREVALYEVISKYPTTYPAE